MHNYYILHHIDLPEENARMTVIVFAGNTEGECFEWMEEQGADVDSPEFQPAMHDWQLVSTL